MDSSAVERIDGAQEALPPRLVRMVLVVAALLSGLNLVGTAFSPWLLLRHPLVLVALSADVRHLVLAAGRVDVLSVALVGTVRRILSMVSTYGLTAVYGFAAIRWMEQRYPRASSLARGLERLFQRRGAVLLVLFPSYTLSAVAGAARSPLRPFLVATAIGQGLVVTLYGVLGSVITAWTEPILAWLGAHLLGSTAACVAAVALQQIISRLRQRKPAEPAP